MPSFSSRSCARSLCAPLGRGAPLPACLHAQTRSEHARLKQRPSLQTQKVLIPGPSQSQSRQCAPVVLGQSARKQAPLSIAAQRA